jgi:hypothetical protein
VTWQSHWLVFKNSQITKKKASLTKAAVKNLELQRYRERLRRKKNEIVFSVVFISVALGIILIGFSLGKPNSCPITETIFLLNCLSCSNYIRISVVEAIPLWSFQI